MICAAFVYSWPNYVCSARHTGKYTKKKHVRVFGASRSPAWRLMETIRLTFKKQTTFFFHSTWFSQSGEHSVPIKIMNDKERDVSLRYVNRTQAHIFFLILSQKFLHTSKIDFLLWWYDASSSGRIKPLPTMRNGAARETEREKGEAERRSHKIKHKKATKTSDESQDQGP